MTNTGNMGQVQPNNGTELDSRVRERPILFSSSMVRAILGGKKTVTRRIVKPQPAPHQEMRLAADAPGRNDADWFLVHHDELNTWSPVRCPYGSPGDRLWVRETWTHDADDLEDARARHEDVLCGLSPLYYRATEVAADTLRWRPAIHMPRWASRITLEVTGIHVERLHDITEEDAAAEGIEPLWSTRKLYPSKHAAEVQTQSFRDGFRVLWDSINGKRAPWSSNPWLWVVSFRRVEAP